MVEFLSYFIFAAASGYYLITNLQWYSYKLKRVIFHHTKPMWNFVYFIVPFIIYIVVSKMSQLGIAVSIIYVGILYFWFRGLDKPLVWTGRIKRFFAMLVIFALLLWFAAKCTFVLAPFILAEQI